MNLNQDDNILSLKNESSSAKIWRKLPSIEVRLGQSDYWVILFICTLSLFASKLFFGVFLYCLCNVRLHFKNQHKSFEKAPADFEQIISHIHANRLRSLAEAIESNPQILYCDYKKKSLLVWCKHYNNRNATSIIFQMTQKYPKEILSSAA